MASSATAATPIAPPSRQNPAPLTNLAKKYGHPYKKFKGMSHRVLKYTGKSGVTPLSPFFRNTMINRTAEARLLKYRTYFYQQHRFQGFTASELSDMESLSALDGAATSSSLRNTVHPMFQIDKWDREQDIPRHLPLIPLFTGHGGFWLASNPTVWRILGPALRLASCLLSNASVWPWWDALFNGSYNTIKSHRIPPEHRHMKLNSFHARRSDVTGSEAVRNQLKEAILDLHGEIRFGLFSGYTNPLTGLPRVAGNGGRHTFGMVTGMVFDDASKVWIAIELLQPLLRDDLTDSERISNSFRIATTIIHECAHAVWERLSSQHPSIAPTEPYFENEPLSELGWSLEDKLWGGFGFDIVGPAICEGGPGLPNMGIFFGKWFTEEHRQYRKDCPALDHHIDIPIEEKKKDVYFSIHNWPVPTSWTKSMFNPSTWDTLVRQFGAEATQIGPLTYGTQRYSWFLQDYHAVTRTKAHATANCPIPLSITASQQALLVEDNKRRAQARSIIARVERSQNLQSRVDKIHPDSHRDGIVDIWDEASDSEDEEDERTPTCLRWQEIKAYLFRTRGPSDLAWDSMTFEIPEWTLYRYIQTQAGLWHGFLVFAHHKKELFQYRAIPWIGAVKRIAAGWPTTQCPLPSKLAHAPSPSAIYAFEKAVQSDGFQSDYYHQMRDLRDMDCGDLLKFLNLYLTDSYQLSRTDLFDVLDHWARIGQFVTWGPFRIARLTIDIPQRIKDKIVPPPPSPSSSPFPPLPATKTQAEKEVEAFEKEADDPALNFDLSDLELSSSSGEDPGPDDSGVVL